MHESQTVGAVLPVRRQHRNVSWFQLVASPGEKGDQGKVACLKAATISVCLVHDGVLPLLMAQISPSKAVRRYLSQCVQSML